MKPWTVRKLEGLKPGESFAFYRGAETLEADVRRNYDAPAYQAVLAAVRACAEQHKSLFASCCLYTGRRTCRHHAQQFKLLGHVPRPARA
jgi:hypothetical protein